MLGSDAVEFSQPSLNELPEELLQASLHVGAELEKRGHKSWIVGGAVRDLCMGRPPSDVDITTDATPDEVEACFPMTIPLGKRFGTVLVKVAGLGIEVTTLRAEEGYDDARRPNEVIFGTSVQKDAERRDFTCNAMYLDPLTGEFLDPAQGLEDLALNQLVAVGDPGRRFQEDGLRIFRLARFAATLGLEPTAETLSGAVSALDSLRGVSGERMLAELSRGFSSKSGGVMLEHLSRLGVHRRLFPSANLTAQEACVSVCRELSSPPGLLMGLLLFTDPDPLASGGASRAERAGDALDALALFRPSRELRASFMAAWRLCGSLEVALADPPERGELRLLMREPAWDAASDLAIAASRAASLDSALIQAWREDRSGISDEELFPSPLIGPEQLEEVGLPRGPAWGEAIAEGLRRQLGGELKSAEEAMSWLRRRLDA
ncbi:MAG: hypothetical protein CMK00_02145 [Planctomycetes bacterium]|nr:hypothetical protein [Planctomycetota bacterium]